MLYLCLLFAGCLHHSFSEPPKQTVLLNSVATLPCPHATGDVTWSRFNKSGKEVTLISIKNGQENRPDKRFGSLANGSLVITKVQYSDTSMYLCNKKHTVYLEVVNSTAQTGGKVPVTPGNVGPGRGLEPDTENQQPSDSWKIPVGVVIGVTLVLSAILTLRFCSGKRSETNTSVENTAVEGIYEEIEDGNIDVESPYYWSTITETPNTSTSPSTNLYSTVNKVKTKGVCREEGVYSLAQNPLQTGNISS
ncbi:uncharacterized protein LOC108888735 isoform X4 [Lates calcarifer]|uniref:Uncharacterized protein LOC108888735 isoform X1 n=1 Tax=Lates calcarifer TaxID=8187 RepID=A0AAJ8B6M4_LATCA|nr:uncharacterized protein LOC108888735 isoform X2 [Lates calcarifer]XP_050926916.1 uncharacterized protein LOC108888735 isoform X1 [Lates calcarifer]XP_050926917.1 uncharacterized protein LOC108888735 isoform X3 [Lates calcarifer]XP_050926918.1 uncharacterized protein LOC108888735 isoform X4 [Lates calcarifer]